LPARRDANVVSVSSVARGDALFAEGRFADATIAYEGALKLQPNSGALLAALSRMRLYQHRESEAIELARRALSIMPDSALAAQVLRSANARLSSFGASPPLIRIANAHVSIPFVLTDPLPVVRVRVRKHDGNFILDTGAPGLALNRSLAVSLGLPLTAAGEGTFAGGQHARVERTMIPELEIGGIGMANVSAVISPAELELPGIHMDGVIGTGFLMHFLSTIDYCRGVLVLSPLGSSATFERRAIASNANLVPMWLVGDHFIFARGAINNVEGLFSIDTGLAGGALVATKSTIETAGIKIDQDKPQMGQGGGGVVPFLRFKASASFGRLKRNNLAAVYMPSGDPYGIFPFKVAGALSHGFFRQSRLTFDFVSMKLITEQCSN